MDQQLPEFANNVGKGEIEMAAWDTYGQGNGIRNDLISMPAALTNPTSDKLINMLFSTHSGMQLQFQYGEEQKN
jgi:hypothetical protein